MDAGDRIQVSLDRRPYRVTTWSARIYFNTAMSYEWNSSLLAHSRLEAPSLWALG